MNLQKKMYIHLYTIIDWLCENRFLITKLHGKILFRAKHINIVCLSCVWSKRKFANKKVY